MPKALDPDIKAILDRYGLKNDALWDCHGTWVMYHWAVELAAAKAKITFDLPNLIEGRSADKIVALLVSAKMGDRVEWSIGEAAPANNKNSYPYAMAEKRAKDRVALKLLGLSGLVYSEEEADDFKPAGKPPAPKPTPGVTKAGEEVTAFCKELTACVDKDSIIAFLHSTESKKFAVRVCRDFAERLWFALEGSEGLISGLRDNVLMIAQSLDARSEAEAWVKKVEEAAKEKK